MLSRYLNSTQTCSIVFQSFASLQSCLKYSNESIIIFSPCFNTIQETLEKKCIRIHIPNTFIVLLFLLWNYRESTHSL